LNENAITTLDGFLGHENLAYLELKKNKLTNLSGFGNMLALQELLLNENEITSLSQLGNLPALKKLDLNANKITRLEDLPHLPALESLDLGANLIEVPNGDIPNLALYKNLKFLNMAGNPFADAMGDKIKIEVILMNKKIKFVGEEELNEDDHAAAKEEMKERVKAAVEAERLAAEKLARGEVDQVIADLSEEQE
jgi:hypothetical protein